MMSFLNVLGKYFKKNQMKIYCARNYFLTLNNTCLYIQNNNTDSL